MPAHHPPRAASPLLTLTLLLSLPLPAAACLFPRHQTMQIWPEARRHDRIPPRPLERVAAEVRRPPADDLPLSCSDLATVALTLAPTEEGVAYHIEVVDGHAPFTVPDGALRARQGRLLFVWKDAPPAAQWAHHLTLRLTPTDAAGNLGPPFDVAVGLPGTPAPAWIELLRALGLDRWAADR